MSTEPDFTVVVPTHGRQALLDDALASVSHQTLESFECLIVDDASTEPLSVPEDPRFRLIRRDALGGAAAARNTGIAAARGRFVAFLDSDDLFVADRLERALEAHRRAPVVVCAQAFLGEPSDRQTTRLLEGDVHDSILDEVTPHLGATSVRRECCLLLDEQYLACEDVEWWLRQSATSAVATVTQVGYLVRRHDEPRAAGPRARVEFSRRLMSDHHEYFATHRRARAFRLYRCGVLSRHGGDIGKAARAGTSSWLCRPSLRALRLLGSCGASAVRGAARQLRPERRSASA